MLGVLKRRWKPKRASGGARLSVDTCPVDVVVEKTPRCMPSGRPVHQVHPVCEDKAHMLAYEKRSPPATIDCSPTAYPPAPNICVEAGRIEFIKVPPSPSPTDGSVQDATLTPPAVAPPSPVTVTRAQQTTDTEDDTEKFDVAKESLEDRIAELEQALEAARTTELRDKQTLTKLQKQLSRRETAQRDVERERRLRAESEARLREAAAEAARCRTRLKLLTQEFSRMEETVRAMLVYKSRADQLKQEKAALTVAFEKRSQQYQSTINRLSQEVTVLRQQLDAAPGASEGRLAALEADNAALCQDAETTRRQYERCLDGVANQVVRALLAQKNLREEIGSLTRRIKDLETQNRALTTLLVHQLNGDTASGQLALEGLPESEPDKPDSMNDSQETSNATDQTLSPCSVSLDSSIKHCNSFNSDCLSEATALKNEIISRANGKHLSADADILEASFSLEDKKRHHVLAKLWTELKGSEVTPQKLLDALSAVDSSLWVPPKRPVSLNLQLPIFQNAKTYKSRPVLAQSSSKSEEETGNESPESGNRDEGYSTMSSDVQGEVARVSGEPSRGLEDLKEANDETDLADARIIVVEDQCDPDILYIPLNFAFGLNPRNSFPPSKAMLPFQHIMRSFSDSHLCLKITTAPSPCYSIASPISSSPSILLLDITDAAINPLRRAKATAMLPSVDFTDEENRSRCSQEDMDAACWDTDYVQQWLRLDESRSAFQQHQRDLLELEYDRAELEDWSLSLSNEELRDSWKKPAEIVTPGQITTCTLPSIQENNALELEEDSNEYLWNNSSYMMDKTGGELVALLMDAPIHGLADKRWPYGNQNITSPGDSWSSAETNSEECFHNDQGACSKRSSAALSGCSDDTNESHPVGTDFTRDFYRLVKFESTKSLASISSRSAAGCISDCDREQALQSVLTFIAEQQFYCSAREECDPRPSSIVEEPTKEFNIEGPPQRLEELSVATQNESDVSGCNKTTSDKYIENYVNFKQLKAELALNEQNSNNSRCAETPQCIMDTAICDEDLYINGSVQNSNLSQVTTTATENSETNSDKPIENVVNMTESQTSSVSTPDTIVSRIPRRQLSRSSTPSNSSPKPSPTHSQKIPQPISQNRSPMKSKIPAKDHRNYKIKSPKIPKLQSATAEAVSEPVITSERLPAPSSSMMGSSVIDGPPHRAISFHERATSKDLIDELNRMIRKEGENGAQESEVEKTATLDEACRSTGWIHVEKTVDLNDPKARESILDVMLASSDSSPTSSCGGSVSSESTDEPADYGHLHRIHRYNRQRKACAVRPRHAVLRGVTAHARPSIVGREDLFVRYGDKEKEAVASFDFLDQLSTASSDGGDALLAPQAITTDV